MTKNITSLLSLMLAVILVSSCSAPKKAENKQPNIIYIMSDDHAYQAISSYGYGLNETPNIDRLADEGALFTRACVTNSLCAPSRAVLLTGKHSFINGKVDNVHAFNWDQDNFPKLLQANGYQTAMIGKIHMDGIPQGFDFSMVLPGQGSYYNPVFLVEGERVRKEGYVTDIITETALDWLETKRDPEKPFCLLVHQKAPHRNWLPAPEYVNLYDDKTFDLPETFFDDYSDRGSAAKEQEMEINRDMMWGHDFKFIVDPNGDSTNFVPFLKRMNPEQRANWMAAYESENQEFLNNMPEGVELAKWKFNRYIKDYLRCIKSVDDGVGEILDYVKKSGLEDNTIIVYTSDQGFYLGEHGWFDKRFMYEESLRTPLIIRYPKEIKAGTTIKHLVQNLDFAPTFLDYAGVEVPADMQGESFRKLVSGETTEFRDAIYYTYYEYPAEHMVKRHYGVATDRYKLMHFYYDVDEWELYDLENDPQEMHNVYGKPEYADIQQMMHNRLAELRTKYGDSDELDQQYLNDYLETRAKRKKQK
ncbi:sulfatase family protein [Mangrovibacterium diazotrophicum]|uniref:Arylsulfatase A-like enzyme n=1 Tax=Mangrovibacterium diazotrophicum TaxID=1261403 RepID=A0A419W8N0_9BACT|nr:sulfatase [Mangrovibacterium diazotrophicum]RKD91831.1 arylsulfatase A-like enzyme [Mangrovibacterium diazotrophicum]